MTCAPSRLDVGPPSPLARLGHWMQRNARLIQGIQWAVVVFYWTLVAVPAFLPLPDHTQHIWSNLTLFAQFLFWGIWWPFVLVSMLLMGRVWCGVFCPEGTLTQAASRYGKGRAIPRWLRWGGWPFVAFIGTTVYGQMISVYQYPLATLLILGGSTVGAIGVGYWYGKDKRVWCRYMCPVNGVFGLLAKLAPVHFKTDQAIWRANRPVNNAVQLHPVDGSAPAHGVRIHAVNCPTLLPLRELDSASACHMCGRCSGSRDAITLSARAPGSEIVNSDPEKATLSEFLLVTYGLGGIAVGAFHWSASPWFVMLKQQLAEWLVMHDAMWTLETSTPWWLFTNYPEQNDVFNLLDGSLLLAYILATGAVVGTALSLLMAMSNFLLGRWSMQRLYHLSYALIPIVGCGVFLGLSSLTITLLRAEQIPVFWANPLRAGLLIGAAAWSFSLLVKLVQRHSISWTRRIVALVPGTAAIATAAGAWWLLFWGWAG